MFLKILPKQFTVQPYGQVFSMDPSAATTGIPSLLLGFLNTMWMTLLPLIVGLIVSGLSAYAFSKLQFPGREKIFRIFHSDQGWQYQHGEYQKYLKEHNIIQSMSRKGNCMDNGAMENFFGRLKVEMFYGEKFETVDEFVHRLKEYIDYWNNERISLKLKGMSPVGYRTHYHTI